MTGRNSRWYEAARWLVSVGGTMIAGKGGQDVRIGSEADIPAGRFEVRSVTLQANPKSSSVTDDDFARFSGLKELTQFEVRGLPVTDAAFAFLPTTPNLTYLTVAGARVTNALVAHLAPLSKLTTLQIQSAPNFTGKGMDRLAANPVLQFAWLSESGITDEGLQALAAAANLQFLRLDFCPAITDAGVAPLGRLSKLGVLSIMRCSQVQGTAFAEWGAMPSLRELNVQTSGLREPSLAQIAKFTSLESLGLDDLKWVDDEALATLAPLTRLTALTAVRTEITGTGFAALQDAKLSRLMLHYETPISGAGLAAIAAAFPTLERFALGAGLTATAQDAPVLRSLKSLKEFELLSPTVDDRWAAVLAELPALESLQLSYTGVTAEGLAHLKKLKNLRRLGLNNCPNLSEASVPELLELKALTSLELLGAKIGGQGFSELREGLPKCRILGPQQGQY